MGNEEKVKIAVLATGGGTNLQALLDAEARGDLPHGHICLVIASRPGVYALERARLAGVRNIAIIPSDYPTQETYESALISLLDSEGIELIILAGFTKILSGNFTSRYPDRIINVHPSLIPSFCGKGFYGLRVHEAVLEYGVKVTGATVHFVNEVTDGGKIILQRAVEVKEGDTPEKLQRRVMEEAEWKILPEAAELVCAKILKEKNATNLRRNENEHI